MPLHLKRFVAGGQGEDFTWRFVDIVVAPEIAGIMKDRLTHACGQMGQFDATVLNQISQ